MNNQRTTTILLVAMSLVTLTLVGAAVFLFLSGENSPFSKESQALRAYIQAPPVAEVGKETKLVITVENISAITCRLTRSACRMSCWKPQTLPRLSLVH